MGFRPQHKLALGQPRLPGADKVMGDKAPAKGQDDKLSTLRAYRRARGLCEVCAEKWVRGHKCDATISLQAMQEVWDFFNIEPASEDTDEPDEQLLLALSHDARMGSHGQRTIRFHGTSCPVVFIDSGSSSSFLAASIADQLPQLARVPVKVVHLLFWTVTFLCRVTHSSMI